MKEVLILIASFISFNGFAGDKLDLSPEVIAKAIKSSQKSSQLQNNDESKIFIIKVKHNSVLTEIWAKKLCQQAASTISLVYGENSQSHCFTDDRNEENNFSLLEKMTASLRPDFQINLDREFDSNINVTLINLKQTDTNITNKVGWKILYQNGEDFQYNLQDRLLNSYFAINNTKIIRDLLVNLVYRSDNQNFVKPNTLSRDELYSHLKKSKLWTPRTRKFLTAGSELLSTLSFGWYGYHFLSTNQQDFDYEEEGLLKSLENKLSAGSMVRYDDNSWNTNKNHVYAGVVYYLQCRGVGFTALESYLCAIAGSTAWEALVEWREVFSINDQIFTSTGGAILAESIHQMGNYIDQKAPRWFKNSIGWAWRGPKKMSQLLNSNLLSGDDSDLESSDKSLLSGKFEFEIGTIRTSNGISEKRIGISNEVTTIPFYLEPGREVKFYKDVVETNFNFSSPTEGFTSQYDIFAKVVMAAYYNKNISIDKNQQLQGYSFYIGPSSGIDIRNNQNLKDDFMGIVHVIGTTAKIVNFYKGFKISSTLDFWGDSVMMKSMQIEKYQGLNPRAELVENLASANYFHGFGTTSKGQVIIEYGNWSIGASLAYNNEFNTNTRQRALDKILTELDIRGSNFKTELFIERKINDNLKVQFAVENSRRAETIIGFGKENKSVTTHKVFITYYF